MCDSHGCGHQHNCTCECDCLDTADYSVVYMYAYERGRTQGRKEGIEIGRQQAENEFKDARWKEYESRREV